MPTLLQQCRLFYRSTSGNVALIFGLCLIPLMGMVGAAVDYSRANSIKASMQAAVDATALYLAVSPGVSSMSQAQLTTLTSNIFTAEFHRSEAQNVVATPSYSKNPSLVTVSATGTVNTAMLGILNINKLDVGASATVKYAPPMTISLNIVFDSSASMIVGATPNDVTLISNWVSKNWNLVKPNDPPPKYPGGDNPPCAFACHDAGGSTTSSDISLGLSRAHSAGATTRFDVMIAAAQQLIAHVQNEATNNPQLKNNTYLFNVLSFDTVLNRWGSADTDFKGAINAVQLVSPGLDTHLFSSISQLIKQVGTQGDGTSSASPLKFVILITDGLQSDRGQNWGCSRWAWDTAWNYNTCYGGYATTIDLTQCKQMKDNGIVLAVLETPYVPLTGQSPKVAPYEKTVRHVIYPGGAGAGSVVSQALLACASTNYYFQATSSSAIATGFLTLTDKFLSTIPYLSR